MSLSRLFRGGANGVMTSKPRLEELEDRVTPAAVIWNIQIVPQRFGLGGWQEIVTPKVVAQVPGEEANSLGTSGANATGTLEINLNGQTQRVAVNPDGTTNAVTFTLPPGSLLSGETLTGTYTGTGAGTFFNSSTVTPVYLNLDMLAFNTTITINGVPNMGIVIAGSGGGGSTTFAGPGGNPPRTFTYSTTVNGEQAQVNLFGFLPLKFNYTDPGTIQTVNFLGINLPGSFSPLFQGFVSPLFYPSISLNGGGSNSGGGGK